MNHINIRMHNRKSLEIKLEYVPDSMSEKSDYNIDFFLFFPEDMEIDYTNYDKKHFYQDLTRKIRLKTPDFVLNNYYKKLKHFDESCENNENSCEYLYKKFICGYRAMLRNHTEKINDNSKVEEYELILEHITKTRNIFRKLVGKKDRKEIMFVLGDEFTSVVTNIYLVRLYDRLTAENREILLRVIKDELKYRQENYPHATAGDDEQNERLLNRYYHLKDYFYSVLHLKARRKKADRTTTSILYAVAAGLSMVFATLIAFWAQKKYGNFTMPFFAALVIGYMFKDRLKEGFKSLLKKLFAPAIYDFETQIFESKNLYAMGKTYERAAFITPKDLPSYAMNGYDQTDRIIHFNKKVKIFHKKINTHLDNEIRGVTDLMMFKVGRIISGLEEPLSLVYSVAGGTLEKKYVEKVYDMNVIVRVSAKDRTETVRGIMTISARGIKRFRIIK